MIEFRNVTKTYDTGTKAVKNANFLARNIFQQFTINDIMRKKGGNKVGKVIK